MAVDQKIEFFIYELFNRMWLDTNPNSRPLTRKGEYETPVESEMNDSIYRAVQLRVALSADLYTKIIRSKYWYFSHCTADFYTFLQKYFPSKDYSYLSVMDKILALCAFVVHAGGYSQSKGNCLLMSESYVFCAMYIDQELKTEFYKESGWVGLNRTCHSYTEPYEFCLEISSPTVPTAQEIIRSIDKFQQFLKHVPDSEFEKTPFWVLHCLEDMYTSTNTRPPTDRKKKRLSVEDLEGLITNLKHYCDPLASIAIEFDIECKIAKSQQWDANLFLKEYFKDRRDLSDHEPIDAEFLILRTFLPLVQADTSLKSQFVPQNCNSEVGASETFLQSLPALSLMENLNNYVNTCLEILDENLKQLDKQLEQDHEPYSFHVAEISTSGSSLDGTYNVMKGSSTKTSPNAKEASSNIQNVLPQLLTEETNYGSPIISKALKAENDTVICELSNLDSLHVAEISTSGSSVDGSYNVMITSSTETSPNKKENSLNIQNLIPKLSREVTRSGSPITSKALEVEKDTVTNKLSKLSSLSTEGIKMSPSYNEDSRVKKNRTSAIKENSQILQSSEAKFSPEKVFKGFPNNPKASENMDIEQETGFLPNFHKKFSLTDGIKISPNYNKNSSLMNMGRLDGKEFSSNIQFSETKTPPRATTASSSIPKSSETKKDKDQVIESLSNLDINTFSPDGNIISPNCVRNSGGKKRRSGGKENTPTIQSTKRKLSPARMSFSSQNTPPNTTMMKPGECKVTDEVVSKDNLTKFNLHSQDSSLHVSRASEVEKEKVIRKVVESKSKPHPIVATHNLPQSNSSSKEYTNSLKEQKVFDYISPTDMEDYDEDPVLSASNIILLQEKVRQKAAAVEELVNRALTKPQTETSQTQLGPEDHNAPKPCSKKNKKKSKKTKKSSVKTRREILDETEEYAQDVLRMTLVMGNKASLMMIKPTLKYYKDEEKLIEKD